MAAKKVAEETAVQKAKLLDLAKKASELIQSKRGGGSGGELARQIHDVNAEIGEAERELTHLKLRKYFPDPSGTKWKLRYVDCYLICFILFVVLFVVPLSI